MTDIPKVLWLGVAFAFAVALSACGDEAFVAVVGACDQVEERVVSAGGEDVEERLGCVRAVCNEALRELNPEAAQELD